MSNFASIFSLVYPAEHGKHKEPCSPCLCTVTILFNGAFIKRLYRNLSPRFAFYGVHIF